MNKDSDHTKTTSKKKPTRKRARTTSKKTKSIARKPKKLKKTTQKSSKLKKVNPKSLKTKKRNTSAQTKPHVENSDIRDNVMEDIFGPKKGAVKVSSAKATQSAKVVTKKVKSINDKSTYKKRVRKDHRVKKKAEYLATLPKSPVKRFAHRLNPKRILKYIFSKKGLFMFFKLSAVGVLLLVVFVAAIFAYFRKDLDIFDLNSRSQDQTTVFYDRTGNTVLYELYDDENRKVIDYEDMPQYIKDATVAIEDKDFYNHHGFSARGITRAAVNNIFGDDGAGLQGGSTITQQFIKNSLLTNERKITRKIKELILSVELERLFSKEEILEMYLNEVAYGGQSYGVQAASLTYFDKDAKELTLDESALLAALPQQPGNFNPYGGALVDQLPLRQKQVLQNMADQGYITQDEADKAKDVDTLAKLAPLGSQNAYENIKAPHFVLEAKKQLDQQYGEQLVASGGLKVITTIDLDLQAIAEQAVADNIWRVDNAGGNNAAITSSNSKTGEVLAMVGSRDFNNLEYGRFNAATALRQPGSSFKPYAYATLFKGTNWGPGSTVYDVQTDFPGWPVGEPPENYCRCFSGATTIRKSLGKSLNIPAIKAGYIAGNDSVIAQAESMGAEVVDKDFYGLSSPLGSNEIRLVDHVAGYTTFANGGLKNDPVYILEITNPKGEIIGERWEPKVGERVLDEQIAYLVTSMLSDIPNSLSTSYFIPGIQHTVKTGTTDLAKDGWMMGYSGCLTTGVWMGHNDNIGLNTDFTGSVAGTLWRQYMSNAHFTSFAGDDCSLQAQPTGIKSVTLDRVTGKIPAGTTKNGTITDIFPSWYTPIREDNTKTNVYDRVSGYLATSCTPEAARQVFSSGGVTPEIPPTDPLYNDWLQPIAALAARSGVPVGGDVGSILKDNVHQCDDVKPKVSLTAKKISGKTYKITAIVTKGTHTPESLTVSAGGSNIKTSEISGSATKSFNHTFSGNGSLVISANVTDEALYSGSDSTSINLQSSTPNPVSPAIVSSSSDNTAISWSSVSGANGYRVCVDASTPPTTCFTPSGTGTSYSPSGLTGTNYVYVEALDANGNLISGSTSSIVTLN